MKPQTAIQNRIKKTVDLVERLYDLTVLERNQYKKIDNRYEQLTDELLELENVDTHLRKALSILDQ